MKSTVNEHYVKFMQYKSKKNSKDLIFQLTSIRNRGKMFPNIYGETHMNIHEYTYLDENEKPLDCIVSDGGMCSVFRSICCIGDSLSSGEFELIQNDGTKGYYDIFDYSWGQYLARSCGAKVYNFSRGGMTAKEYMESFAENKGFWSEELLCQAYIIALGVNDIYGLKMAIGTKDDVCLENFENNKDTLAGWYARIIQKIKKMQPKAKFFLVTMPKESGGNEPEKLAFAELLDDFAKIFDNTYVIDLYKYAPIYDEKFKERFFLGGHMTPAGYIYTAKVIGSYIDYIVRHDYGSFKEIAFTDAREDYGKYRIC